MLVWAFSFDFVVITLYMSKRIVIVLGSHRSGTSVIARGLAALGVDLGDSLEPAVKGVNDKGFWEDVEFNAINTELINYLGYEWHTLLRIGPADFHRDGLDVFKARATAALREKIKNTSLFGIKNPRIAKLLDFWLPIFEQEGVDVSYVIALRHPMSVIRSLKARDGFESEKSYYLWLEHIVPSVLKTEGRSRAVISYDLLMDLPEQQLDRLARQLGLPVRPEKAEGLSEFISEFLDQGLRHTNFTADDLRLDVTVPADVVSAYSLLERLARDELMLDAPEVHELFMQFDQRLRDFAPAFQYITTLEMRLADWDGRIADLQQAMADRDGRIADLQQAVADRDGRIADLQQAVADREAKVVDLREKVVAYRASTSWRVTRPLRWLGGRVSGIRHVIWVVTDYSRRYPGLRGGIRLAGRVIGAWRKGGLSEIRSRMAAYASHRSVTEGVGFAPPLLHRWDVEPLDEVNSVGLAGPIDLAVHAHIYYADLLPEVRGYLGNIPVPYTLYATTDTLEKASEIERVLSTLDGVKELVIKVTENRGRDIAPMLVALGERLCRHDLVLHIHTKKSPHNYELSGWRSYLMRALLGSRWTVAAVIDRFDRDASLGILFPAPYYPVQPFMRLGSNQEGLYGLLAKAGRPAADIAAIDSRNFPAGSMFWFRGKAIRRLVEMRLTTADFAPEDGQDDGTLAHAIERLFLYLAELDGLSGKAYLPVGMYSEWLPGALPLTKAAVLDVSGGPVLTRIIFDHNLGGGTNGYTRALIQSLLTQGRRIVRVYYFDARWIVQVVSEAEGVFYAAADLDAVFEVFAAASCDGIVVNSLIGFPEVDQIVERIVGLAGELGAPIEYKVHDFYAVCPSQHLLSAEHRYCGVPADEEACNRCLAVNPSASWDSSRPMAISEWRAPFSRLFDQAARVTVFDPSSTEILQRAFPLPPAQVFVDPHESDQFAWGRPLDLRGGLHIGVIGTLTVAKGADAINALARHIRSEGLAIPITVVGKSLVELDPEIKVLGPYEVSELADIVRRQQITVFFMASIVPETFSFTISEAMMMGLPIVAFDLGAQGRRVKAYANGRVVPVDSGPGEVVKALYSARGLIKEGVH